MASRSMGMQFGENEYYQRTIKDVNKQSRINIYFITFSNYIALFM